MVPNELGRLTLVRPQSVRHETKMMGATYTVSIHRKPKCIANDLLDYGPPRIFGGGVIAIGSKYNTRCLTDLRNRHTCQRNARRKVKQLDGRPRKTRN